MKNLKFIYSLLVVLVAGAIASCTHDNAYTPGDVPAGPQVCFSNKNATVFDISGEEKDDIQNIIVTRIDTKGTLVVPIDCTVAEEHTALFEFPENGSVVFKDGEDTAMFAIKANSAAMEEDKEYPIDLTIVRNDQTTPYGDKTWTVAFRLFPWNRIKGELDEFATFRGGDIFSALDGVKFSILSVKAEVDVEIYEHKTKNGVFLLKNPWAKVAVPVLGAAESEEGTEAFHLVIDCSNEEKCFIEKRRMGMESSEDKDWSIASDYHPETKPEGIAGLLEGAKFDNNGRWKSGGVITWPEKGLLIGSPNYKAGHMFESNLEGGFRIIFPDGVATDYTLSVKYEGTTTASDLSEITAKFTFNHGTDVTGIKYYLAKGNVLADPSAAIQALLDGSANDICEVADFKSGTEKTEMNININESDIYTIIAAPKNNLGELVEKSVALEAFFYAGFGGAGDHPCDLTVDFGAYTKHQTDVEGDDIGDYNAFSYNVKGSNLKSLAIGCWPTAFLTEYLGKAGNTYEKLFKEEGIASLTIEELAVVQSAEGKTAFYGDLEDNTDYTAVFFGINNYETRKAETFEFKTDAAPVYAGDAVKEGKYTMKNKGAIASYEATFEIKSYQGSSKRFVVTNLCMENGADFFATYDAEAGTLTLDGTVRGRKKEGNLFGKMFDILSYDKDGKPTECYQYESQLQVGALTFDPLVFNIDKEKKEPISIQNYAFRVWIYNVKKDKNGEYTTGSLIFGHKASKEFGNTSSTTIVPYVAPVVPEDPKGGNTEN